ncbi:ATP-binding protein [Deinococcus knuensis]|uniref:ATP-binding protein n=1 Tax=Deinococcus knuensis TaxID=1837380 RepID=UPI00166BCE92|nr:ATP-binding protein [Deinococcus knuensis]
MTHEELLELVTSLRHLDTDTVRVEAKRAKNELPKRIWETLSAFSNTPGGGTIVLGLDEASGFATTGVESADKVLSDLASVCSQMEPPVRALIEAHAFEGQTVIVAEIPELTLMQKPCYYPSAGLTNGAFLRVHDGDRKLTEYEVQVMIASRGQPREDEQPVAEATVEDLDPELVDGLLQRLRSPGRNPVFTQLTDEQALKTLKVLVRYEDRWVPSIGGLLALGRYPQAFLPALAVTFVVYPTPNVGVAGPGGERFLDNGRIEGPIPKMIGPILNALKRNMRTRAVVRGLYRDDLWEYPETALREAIVNALAHRDLSPLARGTPVQIQMFPDRLTIINPGGLFGPVTVELLGEEGLSSTRNQTLLKTLEDTPDPSSRRVVCENRGSGIGAMLFELRKSGMEPPAFVDRVGTFSVTFPNHTLLDQETLSWLSSLPVDLASSQRMALAVMRRGEMLSNSKYRQVTGADSRDATREMGALVDLDLVERVGAGRWVQYRLKRQATPQSTSNTTIKFPIAVDKNISPGERILSVMPYGVEVSSRQIVEITGIRPSTVRWWLSRLMENGLVKATTDSPQSPARRYIKLSNEASVLSD